MPIRTTPKITFEYEVQGLKGGKVNARFRSWDSESPIVSIDTTKSYETGRLIPISLKSVMSERDLLMAEQGLEADVVDLVFANAQTLTEGILDRFERQRGEVCEHVLDR